MPRIIEITDDGAHAMSLAEIQAELTRRFKNKLGQDLALSDQTPQMQIIGIVSSIAAEIAEAVVEDTNGNSIDRAGRALLTDLGSILDIERIGARRSRVTATLTGVSGTGVPAGSQARTEAGDIFATTAESVLSPTGVDAEMMATADGAIAIPAGALTAIVTVIPGWETVTNRNAGSVGRSEQTDDEYRLIYQSRTGRLSAGAETSILSALTEAGATGVRIEENQTNAEVVRQQFPIFGHSALIVTAGASDGDIERAIETRRGQGVGTMTAIRGIEADNAALDSVSSGSLSWAGVTFSGLDLRPADTASAKAAALTALLADAAPAVRVAWIDDRYVAIHAWSPGSDPEFADGSTGSVATDFGLRGAPAAPGPYIRTRERALSVTATVARRAGFPANGLERLREGVARVVDGYGVGEEVWSNDILTAMESVPGTRVTAIAVEYSGADASGVAVPLDIIWTLPAENLEINID